MRVPILMKRDSRCRRFDFVSDRESAFTFSFVSQVGQIHIGDMVNVFRHGSLVMQNLGDSTIPHTGTLFLTLQYTEHMI